MIDVSAKPTTLRWAKARAVVTAAPATIARVRAGTVPKGDPLPIARAATALAVKNTPQTIPYCHPLRIDWVGTEFEVGDDRIVAEVTVRAVDRTGVEVEAMHGASTAALVIYDMLKMIDDTLAIEGITLVEKRGGKSDHRKSIPADLTAAVLVSSDSIARGEAEDRSGRSIAEHLEQLGVQVVHLDVIPDDADQIVTKLRGWIDDEKIHLILTTGGTGFGPRDVMPEAMQQLIEREAPGIVEAARRHGQDRMPFSMLSRGRAGIRGESLVVNLPGSPGGVRDSLDGILPAVFHAFAMLRGEGHEEGGRS